LSLHTLNNNQLIERARQGEADAFAEIYRRFQPAVFRYVRFRVSDENTAEDLTAAVFERMVEKIDTFSYRGRPILAWLYTIARNAVIDHHRRSGYITTLPLKEGLVHHDQHVEGHAERRIFQEKLSAVMQYLTEEQRQVIQLKFFEQMKNREVAQIMGKTVGAVKSLQHRALAALRRYLEE
jgi:RNA polymerase sigma-70 factor (ECF subfamily)